MASLRGGASSNRAPRDPFLRACRTGLVVLPGNKVAQCAAPRFDLEEQMDAANVAESMISTWRAIEAALTPIIGARGVDALYRRSLKLGSQDYPWLAGIGDGLPSAMDVGALRSVLREQDVATATAAGRAILDTFYELLATLVGRPLTERLLAAAWENSSGGTSPQESST